VKLKRRGQEFRFPDGLSGMADRSKVLSVGRHLSLTEGTVLSAMAILFAPNEDDEPVTIYPPGKKRIPTPCGSGGR
jgi:hypothetical protein